jgi:uncharacterized protein
MADMAAAKHDPLEDRLRRLVRTSAWFWPALLTVRDLGLASWCIGAGAVRNLVWDELHGVHTPSFLADVDVAFFDAEDISAERDAALQAALVRARPDMPWEVTNQAGVHTWFEACFGHPVAPLGSLEEAVASWPEYATSVGVRLHPDLSIGIIAPHGLDDLFGCIVRRNPTRVSPETYRQRIAQKRYASRWPRVTVIEDPSSA